MVVGHGAVEAVELGVHVLGKNGHHGVFVVVRVVVEAALGIVLLQLAARARHAGVGHGHGTAGDVLLLEQGDLHALFQQAGGCHKACGAGAHDDDVGVDGLLGAAGQLFGALLEFARVDARIAEAFERGILDGVAGGGCAGDGVNIEVLGFEHLRGPHGGGQAADTRGFVVVENLQAGNRAVFDHGFDEDVVLVAHGLGYVFAVGGLAHLLVCGFIGGFRGACCIGRYVFAGRGRGASDSHCCNGAQCADNACTLQKVATIQIHGHSPPCVPPFSKRVKSRLEDASTIGLLPRSVLTEYR